VSVTSGLALLGPIGCVSGGSGPRRVQPPSAEQVRAMSDAVEAAALAVSGRVDLAGIALENAMADQRGTEAAVSAAMRNRDADRLVEAAVRLQAAQDGVRAAWQAGADMLRHARTIRELAILVRKELVNYELASPGEPRANAAIAIARMAGDADTRLRTVEALTLDLKRRWLLPMPSTGEGNTNDRAGTTP
jgi:hypothetical protein